MFHALEHLGRVAADFLFNDVEDLTFAAARKLDGPADDTAGIGDEVRDAENAAAVQHGFGPLGDAFRRDKRVVVLIDEIDKADMEFPNDLLIFLLCLSLTNPVK